MIKLAEFGQFAAVICARVSYCERWILPEELFLFQ